MAKPVHNTNLTLQAIESLELLARKGTKVRSHLPRGGYIHIDRQVPFLMVYRQADVFSGFFEKLVGSESAYLVSSSEPSLRKPIRSLLNEYLGATIDTFGAVLIIEIWASESHQRDDGEASDSVRPFFSIHTKSVRDDPTQRVLETLEGSLGRIKIQGKKATVRHATHEAVHPPSTHSLLSRYQLKDSQVCFFGIEINPIFLAASGGDQFPMVFRLLHHGLSKCLRQTFFVFSRLRTVSRPTHFHALGPRSLTNAVWDTDRQLAEISGSFDFLLNSTPTNIGEGWNSFRRNRFLKPPVFQYRPIPIDPPILKKQLYSINIDRVEDPVLGSIFREQRDEIDRQLTMLSDRNSRRFLLGSMQLYGKLEDSLIETAMTILTTSGHYTQTDDSRGTIDANAFLIHAQDEINALKATFPLVSSKVYISKDITGLMVNKGNLLIGSTFRCSRDRMRALIQHEVGTHILTFWNGNSQKFQLLSTGLPGYDELQEGLAVLAEYLVGGLNYSRLKLLAGRVMAASYIEQGATFVECFFKLCKAFDFRPRVAYTITSRIYRGGGLTKDAVYLRGLISIINYLSIPRDISTLYIGKIASQHIPIIQELRHRHVISEPRLLPSFLETPLAKSRLETLSENLSPLDLLTKTTEKRNRLQK